MLKYVLAGCSDAQVAGLVARKGETISPQAVTQWRARHSEEIGAITAEVVREVAEYAIATKANRVGIDNLLRDLLLQVRDARAGGASGIETGLVVRREKALGSGNNMVIVEEYEIDPSLVTLIDRLHNSVADELGQKPKPNVNINTGVQVLVRDYHGFDPE